MNLMKNKVKKIPKNWAKKVCYRQTLIENHNIGNSKLSTLSPMYDTYSLHNNEYIPSVIMFLSAILLSQITVYFAKKGITRILIILTICFKHMQLTFRIRVTV